MSKLRNILIGAGITAIGAIGTKTAIDYFHNREEEDVIDESEGDQEVSSYEEEVAYVVVEQNSVQEFLDKSFGDPAAMFPTVPPKFLSIKK